MERQQLKVFFLGGGGGGGGYFFKNLKEILIDPYQIINDSQSLFVCIFQTKKH